jgi:hypothetical protein
MVSPSTVMQALPTQQSYYGVQRNPRPGTAAYMQGKKQTAISIRRYHMLCAALQQKYVLRDIVPIVDRSDPEIDSLPPQRLVHATIDFSAYKESKLDPIKDVELPAEGSYDLGEFILYSMAIREDWRVRQGGVLCALEECGDFFNCMSSYHSKRKTNIAEWDTLFEKLQSGYRKNIVRCMFFGQKDGCLDRNCPFLHDREAVLADRAHILQQRRKRLKNYKHQPTTRQQLGRYHSVLDCIAGNNEALRTEMDAQVSNDIGGDRAYCANRRCMRPWKKDEDRKPLKACKGCKYTMYCSPECQKQDWPRHKKDPCAPIEDIVKNDELWNPIGTRKGSDYFFKDLKDIRRQKFHKDA